ncbi:uncharacterized protein BYT42DRAFT_617561 [Radiomyces spectabilis]|uniref:uncharacterized protein n=1 Tax=Radiomyces spectabilis TaxID=64574 RepID=UPI00221F4F9E|nr:uncharacterized protein BYT42DRAFT_617561 [Radiomyces spectabilis]KAI8369554.1 hypothetical protein BYT42DRAFT_617561 [Radiomyces spectabilis]
MTVDKETASLTITAVQDEKPELQPQSTSAAVRKRTRATAEQLAVLEDTFAVNVSPNSKLRKQLAERLQMSERSIQIWFQNRRAKVKHMQKRAQMQMQQASIRAQLYHYHQQQYGMQQHYGAPLMPLQPYSHQHPQQQQQQQPYYHPYSVARMPLPRAHSVDTIQHPPHQRAHVSYAASVPPAPMPSSASPSYHVTPQWPASPTMSRQSMPAHPYPTLHNPDFAQVAPFVEFHDYLNGPMSPSPSPLNELQSNGLSYTAPSSMPPSITVTTGQLTDSSSSILSTLVPVPDAGPTAMLASQQQPQPQTVYHEGLKSPAPTPPTGMPSTTVWPSPNANLQRAQSVTVSTATSMPPARALSDPVSTIDPSSLIMTPPSHVLSEDEEEHKLQAANEKPEEIAVMAPAAENTFFNATTLTIGTWHRLKLRATDLLCVYRPLDRMLAWHIADNGCHFKMEIALDAVASIEYVANESDVLADVHFDISEPPLYYMESRDEKTDVPVWIQCSDFTEGKQASRYFRHTLKGVSHVIKEELIALTSKHEETRRLVRFLEPQIMVAPQQHHQPEPIMASAAAMQYLDPNSYWATAIPTFVNEPTAQYMFT